MIEELGGVTVADPCAHFSVETRGWAAPFGGFATTVSSSDELSSDAPRINLRRSLVSGPESCIGVAVLRGFWVAHGSGGCSGFTLEEACGGSRSSGLTADPADSPLPSRLLSLWYNFTAAANRERLSAWGAGFEEDTSPSAAWDPRPGRESSPFTGMASDLLLILHRSMKIQKIIPNTANGSICRHLLWLEQKQD